MINPAPNWFASVMGTGIVATAAASLPVSMPGLRPFATVVWALAAALLAALTVVTVRHPRRHHRDPVLAHFYGAPPMAALTVGAGALLLGRDVLGPTTALVIAGTLWVAGTLGGLVVAVAIPYAQFTRTGDDPGPGPFGGWLMPVVPPMVSASTGALLVPHVPAGQLRLTLLLACYAMFGLSLLASLPIIAAIGRRLADRDHLPARLVPTLWIVLGPLGQSITAANLLGGVAGSVLPAPYADVLRAFGLLYGVPAAGFALLWGCWAAALTVRAARDHLPFSLTWWSFTFPIGTCVTGASALAANTGSVAIAGMAVLLYAVLLAAWLTVGLRTIRLSLLPGLSRWGSDRSRRGTSRPSGTAPTRARA